MSEKPRILADRYEVGELIAQGGMSEVHRGYDSRLGRTVAIKLLKPSLALNSQFRVRFRHEAQAAARMSHPTIVRVFDAGEETVTEPGGTQVQAPFIVMELVEGTPLSELVAKGPLPFDEAVRIIDSILTALEYSHRAGVVHRDIKPDNVLIARGGQVKVTDFGIARAVTETSPSLARTADVIGTAAYFSPEQARGETVDARSDLYSTGVVLFEMLTGRTPFVGDSPVAVAYKHISEIPPKPSSVNSDLPPAADVVVARALQKDRDERYQSAVQFREELEQAAAGRLSVSKELSEALYAPVPVVPSRTEATFRQLAEDAQVARANREPSRAWIWLGSAAVVLVVAAVVVWVLLLSPSNPLAGNSYAVPSLAHQDQTDASNTLKLAGLKVATESQSSDTIPKGTVISTLPAAGQVIAKGTTVTLIVSSGKATVSVPDVTGQQQDAADQALKSSGFAVGTVTQQDSPTTAGGAVMSTQPAANTQAEPGSTVNLIVSTGTVTLPNLVGLPLSQATQQLQSPTLGLNPVPASDPSCPTQPGSPVSYQSWPPGEVPQRSNITLQYCTG